MNVRRILVVAFLVTWTSVTSQAQITNPTVIDNISVGLSPEGVGVNPNTNRVYVANYSNNNVSVIDGTTDTVIATITVGTTPGGVGVNPATNRVYVANYSNGLSGTVSVIDGSSNAVMTTISVGGGPNRVGVDPVTNRVYVSNQSDNTVSAIDGSSDSVIATIMVGTTPLGVGVNPATSRVYVANYSSGTVSVIDETTNSVIASVPGLSIPTGVGVNPATNRIYVVGFGISALYGGTNAAVWVIDGTTNSVIATIQPGGYYDSRGLGVGVDPTTNFVYVAYRAGDGSGGAFVSINGATNSVVKDFFVCCLGAPHEVGVNPLTNRVFVSLPGWCCDPSTAHWVSVITNASTDFSFSPISPITVSVGGSSSATVTVNSVNGFSSAVTLSVSPPPAGVSASFTTNPVTPPSGGSAPSTLNVNVGPSVTPSTFTITVMGSSGALTHSTSASVTVIATSSSITNVIASLLSAGCIDNSGIGTALTSKLAVAQAAISAGNIQMAVNILTSLKNQLLAQSGIHIATSCTIGGVTFNPVTVLLIDVESLIDSLTTTGIAPNPITGYVVNSSGLGISGATVSILGSGGNTVATATSDITGFYYFPTTGVLAQGSSYKDSLSNHSKINDFDAASFQFPRRALYGQVALTCSICQDSIEAVSSEIQLISYR